MMSSDILYKILILLGKPEKITDQEALEALECLNLLIQIGIVDSFSKLSDVYPTLFALIDVSNGSRKRYLISEEVKLKVIEVFVKLIRSLKYNIIHDCVKSREFQPIIGHSIHVLCNIGLNSSYKKLQNDSIEALCILIVKFDNLRFYKDVSESAELFGSFLPGISIFSMKIITKDDKITKNLAINCLKTLKAVCVLSLSNLNTNVASNPNSRLNRDSKWLSETLSKLDIICEKIFSALIVNHSLQIKKELVAFTEDFIFEILIPIPEQYKYTHILNKLEVPLTLLYDEEVSNDCLSLLNRLNEQLIEERYLKDLILDEMLSLLTSFSRELQWLNDDRKLMKLRLLSGYVKCLSYQGMETFMNSEIHKQRLFHCLSSFAEFDSKNFSISDKLIEKINFEKEDRNNYPAKKFKWFHSKKCEEALRQLCNSIGEFSNVQCLVDYLLYISESHNPQMYYLLNAILENVRNEVEYSILEEYISRLVKYSVESSNNFNYIINVCLLMEGIAIFSKSENPQNFLLINGLYTILSNVSSDNTNISTTAMVTLENISQNFGFNSIKELIDNNIDYLISFINVKLKNFESNQQLRYVISAILSLTDLDSIKYLESTINNIFKTLDTYYYINCNNLVDIFNTIIEYIYEKCKCQGFITEKTISSKSLKQKADEFTKELIDFLEAKKTLLNFEDNSQENKEESKNDAYSISEVKENETEANKNPSLPYHYELVKEILRRCCHLIYCPDVKLRLTVLNIAINGINVIQRYEDELLPLSHQLWDPLVSRLKENNILVIKKAFLCLLSLTSSCGDFLRRRTISDIFPHLIYFLSSSSSRSYNKNDLSPYKFTLEYDLQLLVLSKIGSICYFLAVDGDQLWPIITTLLKYLKSQPLSLQKSSCMSLKILMLIDPYATEYMIKKYGPDEAKSKIKFYTDLQTEVKMN